ncbi:MAG: sugar phosphate isomerase/epimerase family protein [Ruthenibacterium sp.]|nr:sugar phosphate isomerase/epimerase family protein [Ruthenibacterium sp.]
MKLIDISRISVLSLHYNNYTLDYFLDCQAKLGIKNVELLSAHQGLWMDEYGYQDPAPIRRKLEDRGLSCPVFTPENCAYGYQFAAKEPEAIDRTFRYFANGIRFGAELGAKILEANSGWGYWNEPEEEGFKRSAEMHSRLAEVAKEYGMTIACESLRPQETRIGYRLDQIKRLFDTVNHPNFKVMIDLTAMCVQGETVQRWFDTFGAENIIHSHFQDCDPYGHYVWGDGKQNLHDMLCAFLDNGYTGLFSQELTDGSYFEDPFYHDQRNMRNLRMYTE